MAAAFPATAAAPWMLLIQIYGLFIPNRAARAAAALAVMAAAALIAAGVAAARFPEVYEVLIGQGMLTAMMVWVLTSAGAALYGAVRLTSLQQAARKAREIGSYRLVESHRLRGDGRGVSRGAPAAPPALCGQADPPVARRGRPRPGPVRYGSPRRRPPDASQHH